MCGRQTLTATRAVSQVATNFAVLSRNTCTREKRATRNLKQEKYAISDRKRMRETIRIVQMRQPKVRRPLATLPRNFHPCRHLESSKR